MIAVDELRSRSPSRSDECAPSRRIRSHGIEMVSRYMSWNRLQAPPLMLDRTKRLFGPRVNTVLIVNGVITR